MAEIKSFPNNQDEFIGAEAVMKWLHGRTSGVFAAGSQCAVSAVPDTMSLAVSDGNGWMANSEGDGVVWWISDEKDTGTKLTITGDMADATLPRIDRIVVSWPTTNYVGLPTVEFKKGIPASNPVPPALTNNNIMRQISLAQIRIPAGATAITASMITDERLDNTVCGLVTESLTVDTSVINGQLLAAYQEYTRNMDAYTAESRAVFEAHTAKSWAAFEEWFETVKGALSGDVAGNLQNQINERVKMYTYTANLNTAWGSAPDGGYMQSAAVVGILETDVARYSVDLSGLTLAQTKAAIDGFSEIYRLTTSDGMVTAYSYRELSTALRINLEVLR